MPIKPENRARYPKDWRAIRASIRERAGDRCEGSPAFPKCRRPNGAFVNKATGAVTQDAMQAETWSAVDGDKITRIVLTVGHLDHVPENCAPDNLRLWCQRCHLTYDAGHHAANARMTRASRKASGDLFGGKP